MTITYEFPLMLDTTTSISEMTNAAIQIFPNPANDVITVTGTATASRIEMYNNMGMLVLSRTQLRFQVIFGSGACWASADSYCFRNKRP